MKAKLLACMMANARNYAKLGTCSRLQVGAVFATNDGVMLSSGYNGAPAGMPHCKHDTCRCPIQYLPGKHLFASESHEPYCELAPCQISIHAEANGMYFAARHGISLKDAWCITTHSPCVKCAQGLLQVGVSSLAYGELYRDRKGVELVQHRLAIIEPLDFEVTRYG